MTEQFCHSKNELSWIEKSDVLLPRVLKDFGLWFLYGHLYPSKLTQPQNQISRVYQETS